MLPTRKMGACRSYVVHFLAVLLVCSFIELLNATCASEQEPANNDEGRCVRGHFLKRFPNGTEICKKCTACRKGLGVKTRCKSNQDTVCESCEAGRTFSAHFSRRQVCHECTSCPEHRQVIKQCNRKSDIVCSSKCMSGYYLHPLTWECEPCSLCYTEYPEDSIRMQDCVASGQPATHQCSYIEGEPRASGQRPTKGHPAHQQASSVSVSSPKNKTTEADKEQTDANYAKGFLLSFTVVFVAVVSVLFNLAICACIMHTSRKLNFRNTKLLQGHE